MRAVRMISNITKGTYEEKLKQLNLTTLEERRWRGDMIQTWMIMTKDRGLRTESMLALGLTLKLIG